MALGQGKVYLPGTKHDDVHKPQAECRRVVSINDEVYKVRLSNAKLVDRVDEPR